MNLLELVQAQLTEARLDQLASIVTESGGATRKALSGAALPAVLARLSGEFAGEAGAARLLELMRAGGHDGSLLANLDGALAGGAHTEALLNLGKGQIGAILGDRIDATTELMAADTGIRRTSAVALLGLLVPIVLGTLGRQLAQGGGGGKLAGLLSGARPALAAIAAPGLGAALGVADLAAPVKALAPGPARGTVWPWLIVPACTLAMFFALRSCQQGSMRGAELPAAPDAATSGAAAPSSPAAAAVAPGGEAPATAPVGAPPSAQLPFAAEVPIPPAPAVDAGAKADAAAPAPAAGTTSPPAEPVR